MWLYGKLYSRWCGAMQTECKETQLAFQGFGRREVVACFDRSRISSDGGLLLEPLNSKLGCWCSVVQLVIGYLTG
jgi:hypothetical protein